MRNSTKVSRRASLPLLIGAALGFGHAAQAQEAPKEEDFFKIMRVAAPEGIVLEVGGLAMLPNGDLGVSTRRGDVFVVQNPTSPRPYFRKFASGLHEVLGLAYKDGALYCAQRGELTKLADTNNDGKADVYETVYAWPLSGHYHEYSFGPKIAPDGSFFVTGNVAFGNEQWYRGESRVPWRGWTMHIMPDGKMEPWATGMRSPAGLGMLDGELFYTDNQGDYVGSGGIWYVPKGAFTGHPAGLRWTGMANSPLKLTAETFNKYVDPRDIKNEAGRAIKPENIVNDKFVTVSEVRKSVPELQRQAVILPHTILGISNSEIIRIPENTFGPFAGQLLVGDQGQSKIMRVVMEKVKGEYQGVAFDFRADFQSGVLRMAFAPDGSLFVGETNRGWGSAGEANEGLQRLVWNKKLPFEMRTISARPDGFEIEFTQPVDRKSAEDVASYAVQSFTYKFQPVYGSPPMNTLEHKIRGVKVSEDGLKARIVVDNLRPSYIHNITLEGVRDKDNSYSLVHTTAFYTLNNLPDGDKLAMSEVSTKNSGAAYGKIEIPTKIMADRFNFKLAAKAPEKAPQGTTATSTQKAGGRAMKVETTKAGAKAAGSKSSAAKATPVVQVAAKAPSYELVKPLLAKYACLACHNPNKRQVGPAYADVAKRRYSPKQIVQLIHNPKPENWPEYATEMPPMPQVTEADALKIALWINSLTSQSKSSAKN